MKTPLRLLPLLALAPALLGAAEPAADPGPRGPGNPARLVLLTPAESNQLVAAVRAADDERVAAIKAGDGPRLDAIFSDQLHYAHASGHTDTKVSYMKALTTRATVYETYDYQERTFTPVAPGVVTMTGRVLIRARTATGANDLDLNFLAVWREENGQWRFFAWQSCRNPPPVPLAK